MLRGETRRRCLGLVRFDDCSGASSIGWEPALLQVLVKDTTTLTWIGTLLQLFPGENAADDSSNETKKTEEGADEKPKDCYPQDVPLGCMVLYPGHQSIRWWRVQDQLMKVTNSVREVMVLEVPGSINLIHCFATVQALYIDSWAVFGQLLEDIVRFLISNREEDH